MSLKKPEKREIAYPWVVYDLKKVRMDHCRLKSNAYKESKGLMASSRIPRMRMK